MSLRVATISAEEHLAYVRSKPSTSFLQTPAWAQVKSGWRSESVGWFDSAELVGAGLVLYRGVPRLPQRTLAYLPEGPDIDWLGQRSGGAGLSDWLTPLLAHLKKRGSFTVKMGPPVVVRRWHAATIKQAIADGGSAVLGALNPDQSDPAALALLSQLRDLGWQQEQTSGAGFGDVQPRYVFQVPLAGRTEDEVFAGFNQLWRRNVRKATKAGVEVRLGSVEDLPTFHELYLETAERDHFIPRPLAYFEQMFTAMATEDPDRLRLYLAEHEGRALAATTMVTVGEHSWYSYGASSNDGRQVRPSNAIQWRMITDALAMGSKTYDLRGISDTLDPQDHLFGLIQFKVGTGGDAVELAGEWDYPLRPMWHRAFQLYLERRG